MGQKLQLFKLILYLLRNAKLGSRKIKMAEKAIEYFFEHLFPVLSANSSKWGWPDNLEKEHFQPTYLNALSNVTYKVECLVEGNH